MTKKEWTRFFPFFTLDECGKGMLETFMLKVLMLRKALDTPMHITAGYCKSGHSKNSMHYKGKALDFFTRLPPRQVARQVDRFGLFNGFGIYWWGYHKPFYHIDDRNEKRYNRWVCFKPKKYIYLIQNV